MTTGPIIAELGALLGEPARATMLTALLDGRALTAGELAYAARVSAPTASAHLAKLAKSNLVTELKTGRHHYFRLASPKVAQMLEGLAAVALDGRPRFRPLSREAEALRDARLCYDHFAGRLAIAIADALDRRGFVLLSDEGGRITDNGARFLEDFGIDVGEAARGHRQLCRSCLDWTERRYHIGGALGAAIARRSFALGWAERTQGSRAVVVTAAGRRGFGETFGAALGAARGEAA